MSNPTPRRPFSVSVVTNTAPDGKLCKVYKLDPGTQRLTSCTDAYLWTGKVELRTFETLSAFMEARSKLEPSQALMMGEPMYPDASIVTKATLRRIPPERRAADRIIARDSVHVSWAEGPAIVMVDLDKPDDFPSSVKDRLPNSPESWRELLCDCVPGLDAAPMAWAPSSSSYVFRGDEQLKGLSGQRFYFVIESGLQTDHFKTTLRRALILKGLVWHQVSKSGALLERCPFDLAVYQPSRLDFAAGPYCSPPLEWRPPQWRVWNDSGPPLSIPGVPEASEADRRRIEHTLNESRRSRKPEAKLVREQWVEETGRTVALHHRDLDPQRAKSIARHAVERGVLHPEFILIDEDGKSVRVADLLAEPETNHGRRFHDPLEPDYRDDPRIAVFLVDDRGRCTVYSHAHGGQRWRCGGRVVPVRLGLIHESVAAIIAGLEEDPCDLYRHGDAIVEVDAEECRLRPLEPDGLALRLQRRFDVVKWNARATDWLPSNIPHRDLNALKSDTASLPIPQVVGLSRAPFARADGSAVDTPGYDPASQVLYVSESESPPRVRTTVGVVEAEDALRALLDPFSKFPFVSDLDRGVFLGALLTCVVRQSLAISPGYLITAPAAGSGKTLLAQSLGLLQTGLVPAATAFPGTEEEIRKHVFSTVRHGGSFLLFDNTERGSHLDSPALAGLITSPDIEQRVLGQSITERRPNRMTVAFTGNNIALKGDLNRRILTIRLDPKVEHPFTRKFSFDPVRRVQARMIRLRIACLELLQAARQADAPMPEDSSAFPEWDECVRRTVLWIGRHLDVGLGFDDPAKALKLGYGEDPETEVLGNLLQALYAVFDEREFQLSEVDDVINGALATANPNHESEEGGLTTVFDLERARRAALNGKGGDGPAALGRYLSSYAARVVQGLRLEKGGTSGGARRWRVVRVSSPEAG